MQAGTDGPANSMSGTRPGGDGFPCRPAVVSLSPVIRAKRGQAALDRLVRELAAVEKIDEVTATQRMEKVLRAA